MYQPRFLYPIIAIIELLFWISFYFTIYIFIWVNVLVT